MAADHADDPVEAVRRYCETLATADARLEAASDALDALTAHLAQLEDATERSWCQLSETLRALSQNAVTAEETASALGSLATEVGELAGARLSALEREVDAADDGLGMRIQDAHQSLTQHLAAVESRGYDTVAERLERSAAGIDESLDHLEAALAGVADTLAAADAKIEGGSAALSQSVDQARAVLQEAHTRIESAAKPVAQSRGLAEESAANAEGALTALYEGFGVRIEETATRLADTVSRCGQAASETLTSTVKPLLEAAIQGHAIEPAEEWVAEANALGGVLATAENETRDLHPLVADLGIARRKVPEVQQVIDAMDA